MHPYLSVCAGILIEAEILVTADCPTRSKLYILAISCPPVTKWKRSLGDRAVTVVKLKIVVMKHPSRNPKATLNKFQVAKKKKTTTKPKTFLLSSHIMFLF